LVWRFAFQSKIPVLVALCRVPRGLTQKSPGRNRYSDLCVRDQNVVLIAAVCASRRGRIRPTALYKLWSISAGPKTVCLQVFRSKYNHDHHKVTIELLQVEPELASVFSDVRRSFRLTRRSF
jgi:hypothetical protein